MYIHHTDTVRESLGSLSYVITKGTRNVVVSVGLLILVTFTGRDGVVVSILLSTFNLDITVWTKVDNLIVSKFL